MARWQLQVTDVRTDQVDHSINKLNCITTLLEQVPAQMLQDADSTRLMRTQASVAQQAVGQQLVFNDGQVKAQLHYVLQPTDDGSKLYVTLTNPEPLAGFMGDVTIDALLRAEDMIALEQQHQQQQQLEQQQMAQAYLDVLVEEARSRRDLANRQINVVWNATMPQIRQHLLPEQRRWLKKRELECKLVSAEAQHPEPEYFDCEAKMTRARTQLLTTKIQQLEQHAEARAAALEVQAAQQRQAREAQHAAAQREEQAMAQAQARAYEAARLQAEHSRIQQAIQEAQYIAAAEE